MDKDDNEGGSELSSEFKIRIAALTLPSSCFAATACDSRVESDAEWRPEWAVFVCLSDIWGGDSEKEATRFLMVLVKLWRLPPRLGGGRMTADQFYTEIQLDRTSGRVATSLSNPAKCEAQAARADLGMCLIACTVGGDQTSLTVGYAVVFPDGLSLLEAIGVGCLDRHWTVYRIQWGFI